MAGWADGELDRIGAAQELRLQSEGSDGTLRDPVTMWVVRAGDGVYVCSVRGRDGAWFRGTQTPVPPPSSSSPANPHPRPP